MELFTSFNIEKKYVYTILKKKEFLLLNFFKLSNSEKLKNEERKILFSHIYFCCHMVSRKKAKKKTSTTIRKYTYHRIFLATLNSKIKKNEFSCPKKKKKKIFCPKKKKKKKKKKS